MTISNDYHEDVYRFIWKILEDSKCKLLRINGVSNHIHMLIDLNPTIALSNLMRDIKAKSSGWMTLDSRFKAFEGWAAGYYASTLSYSHKDGVIEYIKSQQTHHGVQGFDDELIHLVNASGMQLYDDAMM